jgi:hypothetical protein
MLQAEFGAESNEAESFIFDVIIGEKNTKKLIFFFGFLKKSYKF